MTRMDYSRNHSRDLSRSRPFHGDEPVFVKCMICRSSQPADGVAAIRAEAERGVKTRMGYHGPPQVWLCRTCVSSYGTLVTLELADELTAVSSVDELPLPTPAEESDSNFWKWALAAGAVVLLGWAWRG